MMVLVHYFKIKQILLKIPLKINKDGYKNAFKI